MKNKRIKNPLIRRIPRKMRCEWRKYLVVGLFLILTIGFVSGMYVANGSMIKALEKSISRYMLEGRIDTTLFVYASDCNDYFSSYWKSAGIFNVQENGCVYIL